MNYSQHVSMYNNVFYFYSHFRVSMGDCCPFFSLVSLSLCLHKFKNPHLNFCGSLLHSKIGWKHYSLRSESLCAHDHNMLYIPHSTWHVVSNGT